MGRTGNALANRFFEARMPPGAPRPGSMETRAEFARAKYVQRVWADTLGVWPPPEPVAPAPAASPARPAGQPLAPPPPQQQAAFPAGVATPPPPPAAAPASSGVFASPPQPDEGPRRFSSDAWPDMPGSSDWAFPETEPSAPLAPSPALTPTQPPPPPPALPPAPLEPAFDLLSMEDGAGAPGGQGDWFLGKKPLTS